MRLDNGPVYSPGFSGVTAIDAEDGLSTESGNFGNFIGTVSTLTFKVVSNEALSSSKLSSISSGIVYPKLTSCSSACVSEFLTIALYPIHTFTSFSYGMHRLTALDQGRL